MKSLNKKASSLRSPRGALQFWIIAIFHASLALLLGLTTGLTITDSAPGASWDWFWQAIPSDLLGKDLLRSVWHFHAQPPLYNLFVGALVKVAPSSYMGWLHAMNVAMGSLMSAMMWPILCSCLGRPRVAFWAALVLAANPALFLYEADPLYSSLTAFLVVASVYSLVVFARGRSLASLSVLVLIVNVLVLTRSLYHAALLLLLVPFVCVLAGKHWRGALTVGLVISAISLGWYAKNLWLFGFFGASSWTGMNLWKVATFAQTQTERNEVTGEVRHLIAEGVLPPAAMIPAFSPPSLYVPFGFNSKDEIGVLSREDYNNINIPAISRMYGRSAVTYIGQHPIRYLRNVLRAYNYFCMPSSQYFAVRANAARIKYYDNVLSGWVQGRNLLTRLRIPAYSFMVFLLPWSLTVFLVRQFRESKSDSRTLVAQVRSNAAHWACLCLVAYTVLVACVFECGENMRFKFSVEPLIWALILAEVGRLFADRAQRPRTVEVTNHDPWSPRSA